jgi:hypothetical protein
MFMIPALREQYNRSFSEAKYRAFLKDLDSVHPGAIEFRVAETPVFISRAFTEKLLHACESIVDAVIDPSFMELSEAAIPPALRVPGDTSKPDFIAFDFGVCVNDAGEYEPQLIEMQGFPSLFAYQVLLDEKFRKHFDLPQGYTSYLGGFEKESYLSALKELILGDYAPENVILLEVFPHQQKTRIDFYCTSDYTGIKPVCITEIIQEDNRLYYLLDGKKTEIKRIYNRVILDDLDQQPAEIKEKGKIFFEPLDVEWAPHPSWFYRISKYTIPFIRHPFVPETFFLHEIKQLPGDLDNYVLKPLFSFAGQGVVIDISHHDIDNIKDPENWILQRKVKYAELIATPDVPAKVEIRIFYFWKKGEPRPVPVNNLARLSKGKMIGVRYNKDKEWVGGSLCLFEK